MRVWHILLAGILLSETGLAMAQCAPGVPSAGNPGCIPPNQTNSPYYQGQSDVAAPAPTPVQPQAIWEDRWGAIALDAVDSKAGASIGKVSQRAALAGALDVCKSHGGAHCEVVISYHNQCAAVAQKPSGGLAGVGHGPTLDNAKELAIEKCADGACQVIYGACSYAERVQ